MAKRFSRRPFLVGYISGAHVTMWFLRATLPPIKGPWTLTQLSHSANREHRTA